MNYSMKNTPVVVKPVWQRFTAYLMSLVLVGQICLPATVVAVELVSDVYIASEINANAQFERVNNAKRQFEKAFYVEDSTSVGTQAVESFHQKLLDFRKSSLPAPLMIPIINGDITIIFPHYPLEKRIGDKFVQARFVRSQIFNVLNRNLLSDAYANEAVQLNGLYNKAYEFSATSTAKFGDRLTRAQVNTFGHNFIWPELRTVNGEQVLVPIVHLTDASVDELLVDGHIVEFAGETAQFNTITVNAGTIYTRRGTFLNTAGDFTVSEGASVVADGDLNLLVGGTLQNLSGRLSAQDNVNIIANQYLQKTVVHRYATRYEQGTRLGEIANVDAVNGNVSIRSYNDIVVQGGTIAGNNIILNADGNIQLTTQYTTYVRNQPVGGYDETQSIIEHTASVLSAKDSIYLMASGAIELNAATLTADEGVIQILADQGIYIANEFNEFQSSRSGEVGNVTLQEQEFQTIAIRSALEAGKGVLIASNFGDITLQATEIKSGDGAQINALNGKVNLLLAKEQDHYFYNRVKEGFWRIKTETRTDTEETAVYNSIVGGIKIQATHGLTLEFGQEEGVTLQDSLAMFEQTEDLAWMAQAYNDPELASNIELVYQELVNIHEYDKSSRLSPAAMAIIAIAMAVVMGPGAGLIGANGTIGAVGFVAAPAMQAGALALATQTAMSFANGNNLSETVKLMHSSDTIRSVATAMITAGALSYVGEAMGGDVGIFGDASKATSDLAQNAIELGNQATQLVVESVVRAGISTVIAGGDLGDFGEAFTAMLKVNAINQLGASLAKDIELYAQAGEIDIAFEYIAHAAVGCLTGVLSSDGNGGEMCAAGAGGSIVATAVSKNFDHTVDQLTDDEKAARQVIKDTLGYDPLNSQDNKALAALENWSLANGVDSTGLSFYKEWQSISEQLVNTRELTLGISRLVAGLGVFIAGGSAEAINGSDSSASNTSASSLWRQTEPVFKNAIALNEVASEYQDKLHIAASTQTLNLTQLTALGIALPKGLNIDLDRELTLAQCMMLSDMATVESAIATYAGRVTLDGGFDTAAREVANGDTSGALATLSGMINGVKTEADKLFVIVNGETQIVEPKLHDQLIESAVQLERLYSDAYQWGIVGERIQDLSGGSAIAAAYKGATVLALTLKKSAKNADEIIAHFSGAMRKTDAEVLESLDDFANGGLVYYLGEIKRLAGNLTKQKQVLIQAVEELANLSSHNTRWLGDLNQLSADELLYKLNSIADGLPLTNDVITKLDNFMLSASKKTNGNFLDDALELQYQSYKQAKINNGLDYGDRDYYLKALDRYGNLYRGYLFNQYINEQKIYSFSEVTIEYAVGNGKRGRIDNLEKSGKDTDGNGIYNVIERKSYDLSVHNPDNFASLLDRELINKYPPGVTMKAAKYQEEGLYNQTLLVNQYVLELPLFNQQLANIDLFQSIAASKGVELRFQSEPPTGWQP